MQVLFGALKRCFKFRENEVIFLSTKKRCIGVERINIHSMEEFAYANFGFLLAQVFFSKRKSAPAGIRTRVIGLKVRYDWPCYTTGALIGFCVSVSNGLFKLTEAEAEEFLFFIHMVVGKSIFPPP